MRVIAPQGAVFGSTRKHLGDGPEIVVVGREFVCELRGTVNVKGKGPMNVWHLVAEKA